MFELGQYFNKDYWEHFLNHVVATELPKYIHFYNSIKTDGLFDDDVYKALASLSQSMFDHKIENYKKWLGRKIPALGGYTPKEVSLRPNGMNCIREYILRY